jgi:C-terminal processing protease CtpA/Prc
MGISPIPGKFSNSDNVFIIVSYVYPNSPADRAGLKRGDIILKIDGQDLDTLNYSALFNMKSYSITLGEYQDSAIYPTTKIIPLTAEIIDSNPIVFDTILQYNNQKIAYMVYAEFISGKNSSLLNKFGLKMFEFKSQGVTDLIVDLRYNPGGEIIAANYIASCIAPLNVVYSNSVLVNFQYNSIYQNYFLSTEGPDSKYLVNRMVYNGYNLNLNRVFFLTGTRTASASELLMTGLQPYMDVFKIGEQTYGKYTGAWVIQDTNKPPKHKWAIVPIVSKYSNSVGFTDFVDGLAPEYFVRDNLLQAKQFGDVNDPALGTAVEIITGQPLVIKKNSSSELNYHMLEGNSNPIKYNLYLENPVFVY